MLENIEGNESHLKPTHQSKPPFESSLPKKMECALREPSLVIPRTCSLPWAGTEKTHDELVVNYGVLRPIHEGLMTAQ